MSTLTAVPVGSLDLNRFEPVLGAERYRDVAAAIERSRRVLAGRVVWNVNSTARGGGVAELLASLLAYARGAGVDARWEVIGAEPDFFTVTKRIHNNLHSWPGDGGPLGDAERALYEAALAPNLADLVAWVRPEDVVIVHDPQPAGLIPGLKTLGVPVIWRCHVGIDVPSPLARRAWAFLAPYVTAADACVFSRRTFVWEGLDGTRIDLIAPVIDAFSAKNQDLDDATVRAVLDVAGLDGEPGGETAFTRVDGSVEYVRRPAAVVEGGPLGRDDPMVLQVSRWDRLKDPVGVIRGFAEHVAPHGDAHLVYAGPAVDSLADDPEGAAVLREAIAAYEAQPADVRARLHLACLPMDDPEENAVIVNALQRRADVVVQKSLAEGFGLTVAEAMWKGRPVVASRTGGIQEQITDGESGILLDDPGDLAAFGAAVRRVLDDRALAERLGRAARERVRDDFLPARSLTQYLDLIDRLVNHARSAP
ncbi:MAG TPA: glycosyltransferase [Acidimicrobiales bacterium]